MGLQAHQIQKKLQNSEILNFNKNNANPFISTGYHIVFLTRSRSQLDNVTMPAYKSQPISILCTQFRHTNLTSKRSSLLFFFQLPCTELVRGLEVTGLISPVLTTTPRPPLSNSLHFRVQPVGIFNHVVFCFIICFNWP